MAENTAAADGYYAEDDMGDDELDLSFLDDEGDDTSSTGSASDASDTKK